MVVVVLTAGAAIIMLRAFNTLDTGLVEKAMFGIQQQAGVMAAICTAVFSIITALRTARAPGGPSTIQGSTGAPGVSAPPAHTPPAGFSGAGRSLANA